MAKKKRRGRKPSIKQEQIKAVTHYVRNGVDKKHACYAAGINYRTFFEWISRGEEIEEKILDGDITEKKLASTEKVYLQFFRSIKKADGDAVKRNVMVVQVASKKVWQAAAWWLERTQRELYGQRVALQGKLDLSLTKEAREKLANIFGEIGQTDASSKNKKRSKK